MMIRKAVKSDLLQLVDLCEAHAVHEGNFYSKEGKENRLGMILFTDHPTLNCWVVVVEKELVGYATAIKQYSTWDADWYLYLDCLFLKPDFRGKGVGKTLMEEVVCFAQSEKCIGIQWQTPFSNKEAIKFYERLGATCKLKERFFWLL